MAFFGFLNMSLIDILDILLVATIIFFGFRWIKGSSAMSIFVAIISLFTIWVIVSALNMKMMTAIMETVVDVGVLALIVIFQPEIRRFLISFGNRYMKVGENAKDSRARRIMRKLFGQSRQGAEKSTIKAISEACLNMSSTKTGALIVLPHSNPVVDIIDTGDRIDASVSARLIENIFFKNSPLHDGAMIIRNDRIEAARCTLPITQKTDIPASYGMRHKAAIGISEATDCDVVVVSEETGKISFFRGGEGKVLENGTVLKLTISESLGNTEDTQGEE